MRNKAAQSLRRADKEEGTAQLATNPITARTAQVRVKRCCQMLNLLVGVVSVVLSSRASNLLQLVDAKGLVGKLPGSPASCQEEPCNSDPQHVLNALKWMSLAFGAILLLPLVMYCLSRLFSKARELWCGRRAGGGCSASSGKSGANSNQVDKAIKVVALEAGADEAEAAKKPTSNYCEKTPKSCTANKLSLVEMEPLAIRQQQPQARRQSRARKSIQAAAGNELQSQSAKLKAGDDDDGSFVGAPQQIRRNGDSPPAPVPPSESFKVDLAKIGGGGGAAVASFRATRLRKEDNLQTTRKYAHRHSVFLASGERASRNNQFNQMREQQLEARDRHHFSFYRVPASLQLDAANLHKVYPATDQDEQRLPGRGEQVLAGGRHWNGGGDQHQKRRQSRNRTSMRVNSPHSGAQSPLEAASKAAPATHFGVQLSAFAAAAASGAEFGGRRMDALLIPEQPQQHRHSIDGSILNAMTHSLQCAAEQAATEAAPAAASHAQSTSCNGDALRRSSSKRSSRQQQQQEQRQFAAETSPHLGQPPPPPNEYMWNGAD